MSLAASSRARNKIRQWYSRESREDTEQKGREALDQALKAQNLPYRKLQGSSVLAQVIRETGFKKADDFYIALGSGKLGPGQIVNKVLQRLKTEQVVEEPAITLKPAKSRSTVAGETVGIVVPGVEDVLVRVAKCCTPVPGDAISGYISLGRGITIHRSDCPNVKALTTLELIGLSGGRVVASFNRFRSINDQVNAVNKDCAVFSSDEVRTVRDFDALEASLSLTTQEKFVK